MEHPRRKTSSRQTPATNGLRSTARQEFRGVFHSAVNASFEKRDMSNARDSGQRACQSAIHHAHAVGGVNKQLYNAKVTVLGDYISHHAKSHRDALVKLEKPKLEDRAQPSPSVAAHHPQQNHLLAALDPVEHELLLSHLEPVALPLGTVVCEAGSRMEYVYFPTTAIISNFYELESGASAEISVTGNDGLVGIALLMGGETTTSRAVVRNAGLGYRIEAEVLKREFESNRTLRGILLRYMQALITQMAQIAVCNCHHNVEQQLCRLLLFSLDRLPSHEIALTQELIASLLGVRRESVTEVAGKLQAAGLIRYNRGHITVLDRRELEARVCECYGVVKSEFARLLPHKAQANGQHSANALFAPRVRVDAIRRRAPSERIARRLA